MPQYSVKDWQTFSRNPFKPTVDSTLSIPRPIEEDNKTCPICFEEFEASKGLKLEPCGHFLCPEKHCQDGVLEQCTACPLCREPFEVSKLFVEGWCVEPEPIPLKPMPPAGHEPWNIKPEGESWWFYPDHHRDASQCTFLEIFYEIEIPGWGSSAEEV